MWTVPVPADPAGPFYLSCIKGVRDKDLRDRFGQAAHSVMNADIRYRAAGADGGFCELRQTDFDLPDVTAREMTWLYETRMAGRKAPADRPGSPCRRVYDAIRTASPHGRCPLCGHRDVTTVDHYLPKSAYTALAVNPANLIPACSECNRMKSARVGDTLHPYYDNVEGERWLSAWVLEDSPPAVQFAVAPPEFWAPGPADRVCRHFAALDLGLLYSMQAARLLSGIQARLDGLARDGGSDAVRDHLRQDEESWLQAGLNSWQAACYGALAASDWFCTGGFSY